MMIGSSLRGVLGAGVLLASLVTNLLPALAHEPAQVQITNLVYLPAEVTLHVGDVIVWTNNDIVAHTATVKAAGGAAGWDVTIPPGQTVQHQLTQAGTVEYFCRFHPNMKARINVLSKP